MCADVRRSKTSCDVLIIEDDLDDAYLLKRAINRVAFENGMEIGVTHSVNGLDALCSVARCDILSRLPSVIVVDLNMPVIDGRQFLAFLRSDMQLRDVPTAVLTTSREEPVLADALLSGADAVFSKPNTQDELNEIVRQILALAHRAPPGGDPNCDQAFAYQPRPAHGFYERNGNWAA